MPSNDFKLGYATGINDCLVAVDKMMTNMIAGIPDNPRPVHRDLHILSFVYSQIVSVLVNKFQG